MAAPPYKLSCCLYGHNLDVRSVAATHDGKIISGSRDMTAKVWVPNEDQIGYGEKITLSSHNNFVSCVNVLHPNSKFPQGLIVTGSQDQNIRLFTEDSSFPIQTLTAHTSAVCKITSGVEENTILSASWDKTAKLWDLVTCKVISTFSGHEAAVWSVLQLPDSVVATASADKKIKIWIKNGSCIRTLSGHTDCVRDLVLAGPQEILSCSNDATVRHWNVETGICLGTFYGHGNYIYSIAAVNAGIGGFVTSSEDKTVRLWINGEVAETIQIPAMSVWCVAVLPNSDIVVGSNDGVVRVFSADPSRQASPEQLKTYEDELAALESESAQDYGGFKLSELPGPEALYEPGKKDGQTRIIRENNGAVVYNWSSAETRWIKLGDVMGSANNVPSETGKTVLNGKEYDYVFNIDIEEGKPPLKLPYNKTDDPWLSAQKFIHDNNLSQYYLEQVANFIISNSAPAPTQSAMPSDFVDPFTGGARYIPQTSSNVTNGFNPSSDPFTGSSRYTPASEAVKTSTYFPQREFLRFDQANLKQILEKLLEFNKKTGDGNVIVNECQLQELIKICEPGASCTLDDISRLDLLLEWPQEIVFPVLDVMRLAIRNNDANRILCDDKLIPGLMKFLTHGVSVPPNNMLALRVLNNMLAAESGQILASKNKIKLLSILRELPPPYTKPLQVAMATLLLNISVVLRRSETPEGRAEAISVTNQILPVLTDQEALFRALVALGTLLYDSLDRNSYSSTFKSALMKYRGDSTLGTKIQECSQQILDILQ